jgi:hypothetical protein
LHGLVLAERVPRDAFGETLLLLGLDRAAQFDAFTVRVGIHPNRFRQVGIDPQRGQNPTADLRLIKFRSAARPTASATGFTTGFAASITGFA